MDKFTITWTTEDIMKREPRLTQEQAELVLIYVKDEYTPHDGVSWNDIDHAIELYLND